MSKRMIGLLFLMFCITPVLAALAAKDPNDSAGSKDPALFSRMPGFHIANYQELEFDRFEFPVDYGKSQAVEGRHYYIDYYANDGIKLPSALQITRNYSNAAKVIGGEAVYEYEDGGSQYLTLKVAKNNTEAWAYVEAAPNGMYKIHVIEKELMNQVVVADAASLASTINETGKAAVYGIYFDSGKSVIKSESESAIGEIVKLLKNDAGLNLYVVGHTDNVGTFDYNIKLSQARAAAVVDALAKKHGIAVGRLTPFGAGPVAPAASNKSEEGRAKNRRVELVSR